jgi:hypothetical protein
MCLLLLINENLEISPITVLMVFSPKVQLLVQIFRKGRITCIQRASRVVWHCNAQPYKKERHRPAFGHQQTLCHTNIKRRTTVSHNDRNTYQCKDLGADTLSAWLPLSQEGVQSEQHLSTQDICHDPLSLRVLSHAVDTFCSHCATRAYGSLRTTPLLCSNSALKRSACIRFTDLLPSYTS